MVDKILIDIAAQLGGKSYEVGGCVRDFILGIEPKDRDFIVTGVPQGKLIEALSRIGETDLVGRSFGVVKFKHNGKTYDISVPRKDRYFGFGHTDVESTFDPSVTLDDDLSRRDFTVNAMARDLVTSDIIDPYGGKEDIDNKKIRALSEKSFEEDPLRLMRAIQFSARLGFLPTPDTYQRMYGYSYLIRHVAAERIAIELVKMFKAPVPSVGLNLMRKTGLLSKLLPEVQDCIDVPQPAKFHVYDVYNHLLYAMDRIPWKKQVYLRVAALLHDIGKPGTYTNNDGVIHFYGHQETGAVMAGPLLERLRLHTVEGLYFPADRVVQLIRNHMFELNASSPDRNIRRFIAKLTKKGAMDQIRLRIADRLAGRAEAGEVANIGTWVELAKSIRTLSAPKKSVYNLKALAVNGRDIVNLGEIPGPIVGKTLRRLLELVIDDPTLNERETLLNKAKELLESQEFMNEQISEKINGTDRISESSGEKCPTAQGTGQEDS